MCDGYEASFCQKPLLSVRVLCMDMELAELLQLVSWACNQEWR
jgi:hypothetical protein